MKHIVNGVWIKKDGTEECLRKTAAGDREYRLRGAQAWERDNGICGICKKPVGFAEFVPDHIKPKGHGGATHDDRLENLQPAHSWCNSLKGSRREFYIKAPFKGSL